MTTQGFFKGKFNAADMAQTQQAAKIRSQEIREGSKPVSFGMALATATGRSHDFYQEIDPNPRYTERYEDMHLWLSGSREGGGTRDFDGFERCSWAIGSPALVMRLDGLYDVVAFAPYRRVGEGVSRERACAIAGSERATRELRDLIRAKTARSLRGLR
jgi:hypothetical protein